MAIKFINVKGQIICPPQSKPTAREKQAMTPHRLQAREVGYVVLGLQPCDVERAEKSYRLRWPHLDWDAGAIRRHVKPKRVTKRPYAIFSSAQVCKAIAEKNGWLDVKIVELK